MIIKLIIITKFISIHHMQHHTVDLIFDPPQKTRDFTVQNHFFYVSPTLVFSLPCSHPLPPPITLSHPPVLCACCVRLCVRLCAEGRVQVRRGLRRWAWRVLCRTSWRLTPSSSLTTPSWAGTAARWASDLRAALCWPVRPCNTPRLPLLLLARMCGGALRGAKWTESDLCSSKLVVDRREGLVSSRPLNSLTCMSFTLIGNWEQFVCFFCSQDLKRFVIYWFRGKMGATCRLVNCLTADLLLH